MEGEGEHVHFPAASLTKVTVGFLKMSVRILYSFIYLRKFENNPWPCFQTSTILSLSITRLSLVSAPNLYYY